MSKEEEGKEIIITKDYLQFEEGQRWPVVAERRSSIGFASNGRTYYVPKSHCKILTSNDKRVQPAPDTLGQVLSSSSHVPTQKPKKSLGDNQTYLSSWSKNGELPKSGVDHVITSFPDDHFPEESRGFIPKVNPNYLWEPDVLESLIMGTTLNERVLLVGMPATGKTTAHEQYTAILKQPFFAINGKDSMEASSFLGSLGPDGKGGWHWQDGTLPMCMKNSFYLAVDEVFKIPPGIQMALQSVWQKGGNLVLDDKPGTLLEKLVKPSDHFSIHGSDNVRGLGDNFSMFGAGQVQDSSTLDRFGIVQEVDYLDPISEVLLLERLFPSLAGLKIIFQLVQLAGLIRKSYEQEGVALVYSLRGLQATCGMVENGIPPRIAFHKGYTTGLADETQIATVDAFVTTVALPN